VRGAWTSESCAFLKCCREFFILTLFVHLLIFYSHATSCAPCTRAKAACRPFDTDRAHVKARAVRLANSKAGIKPTAPLSAFDKENSIEFLLDFLHYLYNYYMVCALLFHTYHVIYHVASCDIM